MSNVTLNLIHKGQKLSSDSLEFINKMEAGRTYKVNIDFQMSNIHVTPSQKGEDSNLGLIGAMKSGGGWGNKIILFSTDSSVSFSIDEDGRIHQIEHETSLTPVVRVKKRLRVIDKKSRKVNGAKS